MMLEAAANSRSAMQPADQAILNTIIKAAGLGSLDRGCVEFVGEHIMEQGDPVDFVPYFSIMLVIGDYDDWFDLPSCIVDAEDPVTAAKAHALAQA